MTKPLILSAPAPRSLDLIFTDTARAALHANYEVQEVEPDQIAALPPDLLAQTRYIIGQPAISQTTLAQMETLRCVFNVESNLINNMPYGDLFARGIHVVTTGAVFAKPVAEMGLAMALCLARDVVAADAAFQEGLELWGGAAIRRHGCCQVQTLASLVLAIWGKPWRACCKGFVRISWPTILGCRLRCCGTRA